MKPTLKIYGYGWVGRAMATMFPEAWIHDPEQGFTCDKRADVGFVCVPTPLRNGALDTSIVENVIKDSREDLLIIRSTVMPGTCDKYPSWNLVYHPEYLGETVAHPMRDQKARDFLILGGRPENRAKAIRVYQEFYNANTSIRQVSLLEAEVIKLSENRAIAYKVAQCQELYDVCQKAQLDYNTIREAVYGDDPRFNLYWTFVYPDQRGFNSKCIPKDVYGWAAWAESIGYTPALTRKMLEVNERYIAHDCSANEVGRSAQA